jgi:hypothetical protein
LTKSNNVAECKYEAIAVPGGAESCGHATRTPIASAISLVEMDTRKIKQLRHDPALLSASFHFSLRGRKIKI